MIKKVHDVLIYQRTYHKDIATRFSPREGFEDLVFTSKTNNPINAANIKDSINYIVDRIHRQVSGIAISKTMYQHPPRNEEFHETQLSHPSHPPVAAYRHRSAGFLLSEQKVHQTPGRYGICPVRFLFRSEYHPDKRSEAFPDARYSPLTRVRYPYPPQEFFVLPFRSGYCPIPCPFQFRIASSAGNEWPVLHQIHAVRIGNKGIACDSSLSLISLGKAAIDNQ